MSKLSNTQWWTLLAATLLVVVAWPPHEEKSLATKFVNWSVDPANNLPILPPQLPLGMGDDPDAVNAHDAEVRRYDALFAQGGWTQERLKLKVAGDPFDPATTRQILVVIAVVAILIVYRLGSRQKNGRAEER